MNDINNKKLKKEVSKTFISFSKEDVLIIVDFLIHQGINNMNKNTIQVISNYHIEPSEEDMFNWLHDGGDESPYEIKIAPYVDELGNILILKDGRCILWEDLGYDSEPYNPYFVEK